MKPFLYNSFIKYYFIFLYIRPLVYAYERRRNEPRVQVQYGKVQVKVRAALYFIRLYYEGIIFWLALYIYIDLYFSRGWHGNASELDIVSNRGSRRHGSVG